MDIMEKKKSGRKRSHAVTSTTSTAPAAGVTTTATMTNIKTEIVDDSLKDFFVKFPLDDTVESTEHLSDYYPTPSTSSDHSLIQSSLEQMGSDILVIKSQLEKKKTKVSLVDIGEKLDRLINHLTKNSG